MLHHWQQLWTTNENHVFEHNLTVLFSFFHAIVTYSSPSNMTPQPPSWIRKYHLQCPNANSNIKINLPM
jgi:hypothetical protein